MRREKKTIKEFLFKNGWSIFTMVGGLVVIVFSFILNLRSDINTTQFQVRALQQDSVAIQALVKEVATIKQMTEDTAKKVDAIYLYFINN